MTIPEYIDAAKRTEGDYQPTARWCSFYRDMYRPRTHGVRQDDRILHACFGLCTEVGELIEAMLKPETEPLSRMDRVEELGDVCWYLAILMDALGVYAVAEEPVAAMDASRGMVVEVGALNDLVKRFLFYGSEFKHELARDKVSKIWNMVRVLANANGHSMESVMARNISKLVKRYPDKFTEFNAVHRDLAAERQALAKP